MANAADTIMKWFWGDNVNKAHLVLDIIKCVLLLSLSVFIFVSLWQMNHPRQR
jgi:hypothetical protein